MGSDHQHYSSLLEGWENDFISGDNHYSHMRTAAYTCLVSCKYYSVEILCEFQALENSQVHPKKGNTKDGVAFMTLNEEEELTTTMTTTMGELK